MQDLQHSNNITSPATESGSSNIPAGATPIDMEELFACIGELYLQVRLQRRTIQELAEKRTDSVT